MAYKKSLDIFAQSLSKTSLQFERDFLRTKKDVLPVDTLSSAMENFKRYFEDIYKDLADKAEMI